MKNVKTTMIASAIALSCGAGNVLADSWTILQTTNLNGSTTHTLTQNANSTASGTTNSVQAINNINLNTTDGVINTGSTQTVNMADNLTFDQDSAGNNNIQAGNNAVTLTVTGLTQSLAANATSTTIKFEQGVTSATGTGNVQAINRVKATTVTSLSQSLTGSALTLDFDQANGADENIQAGNLIDASTVGDSLSTTAGNVTQTITVLNANMTQDSTAQSLQASNALITASGSGVGHITQTFTVDSLGMTQSGADGSVESGNYVGVKIN